MIQPTPEPLAVGEVTKVDHTFTCKARQGFDELAVVYGVVRYDDVFGKGRETFFGYRLALGDRFERLSGYPAYNQNT